MAWSRHCSTCSCVRLLAARMGRMHAWEVGGGRMYRGLGAGAWGIFSFPRQPSTLLSLNTCGCERGCGLLPHAPQVGGIPGRGPRRVLAALEEPAQITVFRGFFTVFFREFTGFYMGV
jgi:hypothetical protein